MAENKALGVSVSMGVRKGEAVLNISEDSDQARGMVWGPQT